MTLSPGVGIADNGFVGCITDLRIGQKNKVGKKLIKERLIDYSVIKSWPFYCICSFQQLNLVSDALQAKLDFTKSVIEASNVRECSSSSDEATTSLGPTLAEVKPDLADACKDKAPCKNGGLCENTEGGNFKCNCLSGYA